jgi:hypothetical protein
VRAPVISGTVAVAQTVHVVSGLWSVGLLGVHYTWQRCDADGSGCADITGAAGQAYAITAADAGHAIAVREDVASPGRTASQTTTPVAVADQPLPAAAIAPSITGVAARTNNLQLRPATWVNASRVTNQWQRCDADGSNCAAIPRATGPNYVLTGADVGHAITVAVTATNSSGPVTVNAALTAVVAKMLPELRNAPVITGATQVPGMAQAVRSAWKATSDTRYAYQWQRCNGAGVACADIPGATSQSYKLKTADARATLRAIHTATNPDGAVSATSAPTIVIKPALPGISIYPRLSLPGRPDVGKVATLTPGVWAATTEIDTKELQFWRCSPRCTVIPTSGGATYTVDPLDTGVLLRGSETAVGPGGTLTVWAPAWIGPVRSLTGAYRTLVAGGGAAVLRTAGGVALASASVGRVQAVAARVPGSSKAGALRVTVRRRASAGSRRLRAWACVAPPKADDRQPCTKAAALRARRVALKVTVARGQRVLVVVGPRK